MVPLTSMIEKSRPHSKSVEVEARVTKRVRSCNLSLQQDSGFSREDEWEFSLLRPRNGGIGCGYGEAQCPQNTQAALQSIRANGTWDGKQIATRRVNFVSFHGVIMKQGVGH